MSLIGKSIGNYQIKAKLGEGGMGCVYLGEHPLIGKRVAVKVLLEELSSNAQIVERFFNEAKAVNDIGHQNIVDIIDFGKMRSEVGLDVVYFIMEYLDGESIASRQKRGGLSQAETLHVMIQSCSALAASHAKGIVHRDLKPDNIYLCPRGNNRNFTKILDFGIAKLTGDGGQSHKTRTGLVIGTPTYMSPEQCEGKGQIDHRSDVYSLGVVMYELLTGRVPFPGDGFGEVLVAHLTKIPPTPSSLNPSIPPEIEALVLHAIEKDRNRRFQTMGEFEAALRDPQAHFASYQQLPGYAPSSQGSHERGTLVMQDGMAGMRGATGAMAAVRGPVTQAGTRVTTLSGASGQVTSLGEAGGGRGMLFAAVALVLAGAGGAGWFFLRGNSAPPVTVTAAAVNVEPPAPKAVPVVIESITITITSQPAGAHVFRAGEGEIGVTPLELKCKKGEPTFEVQLRADGYSTATRSVTTSISKEMIIPLVHSAEPQAAKAAAPKAAPAIGKAKPDKPHGKKSLKDTDWTLMQPDFK